MENKTRNIRQDEIDLINHFFSLVNIPPNGLPIASSVYEYEGGKMGSIHFIGSNPDAYAGDLMAVEYMDSDNVRVVITLTLDTEKRLLDLDFWKEDFSALVNYPQPSQVTKVEGFGEKSD